MRRNVENWLLAACDPQAPQAPRAELSAADLADGLAAAKRHFLAKNGLDFAAKQSMHADHDMTGNASVIAPAWPLRRALGGGSAGIGPAQHDRVRSVDPSPNDDPDVTAHIQALVLARVIGPRAPDARLVLADPADTTTARPASASGPSAPRPPPAASPL